PARLGGANGQVKETRTGHKRYNRYASTLVQERSPAMGVDLQALARTVRKHPGVTAKSEIGLVSDVFQSTDWLAGPGDAGAVVTDPGVSLVVGGEAILPAYVAADPYGAGGAAVCTNLNHLPAMGPRPLTLVDTITGPPGTHRH